MKKIMNEWKSWLSETAPTKKDLPQPEKPEAASPHHRSLPDFYRGKFENGLNVGLNNYFKKGNIVAINKEDYGGLHNINPGTVNAPGAVKGFIFGAQPIIKGKDPAKAIEPIVKMMGNHQIIKDYFRSGRLPSEINIDYILKNMISPPPESQKRSHLSRRASNITDFFKNLPKEE
jgi:hypothetical protein